MLVRKLPKSESPSFRVLPGGEEVKPQRGSDEAMSSRWGISIDAVDGNPSCNIPDDPDIRISYVFWGNSYDHVPGVDK
jgi:hypothetical protein